MVESTFIKLVFTDNKIMGHHINVLSMPMLSTILSAAFDRRPCEYLRYEQASENPENFKCVNRKCCNYYMYELIEITYDNGIEVEVDTPPSSTHSSPCDRKRKYCRHDKSLHKAKQFRRDLSAALMTNARRLAQISPTGIENRYCYINTANDSTVITTQFQEIFPADVDEEESLGYMRIYSMTAKRNYLGSLNYRNTLNLTNHWVVYFSVAKYYQHNYDNIFHLPGQLQLQCIRAGIDYKTSTDQQTYQKLKNIESLLSAEVLSSSEDET